MIALTTEEIAQLTGQTRQAVTTAVKKAKEGVIPSWAVGLPQILLQPSSGGNAGKQYLVPIECLSQQLQERYKASLSPYN